MRWRLQLAIVGLAALVGCSSGGGGVRARDELRMGVEAGRRGYWQEALFRFERARESRPDDPEVLNNVAVAQEALGRYDAALATYKEALQHAPRNVTIKRNYARFAEFYTSYARGVRPKGLADAAH